MKGMKVYERIKWIVGKMAVILIMVVFPFVIHDKLYDVTLTRYRYFLMVTFFLFIVMVVNEIVNCIKNHCGTSLFAKRNVNIVTAALLVSSIISYVVTPYKSYALKGNVARFVGFIFFIACALLFFIVAECYTFQELDIMLMLLAYMLVDILAILNHFNIDILGFFNNIDESTAVIYISTMGNIDIYGMYVVMMFAVALYSFIVSSDDQKIIYYAAAVFLGEAGAIVSNADMAMIGILISFIIVFPISIKKYNRFSRFIFAGLFVFVMGRLLSIVEMFIPNHVRNLDGVSSYFVSAKTSVFIVIGCILYMILVIQDTKIKKFTQRINADFVIKVYACMVGVIAAGGIIFAIINNNTSKGIFYLTDEWGSGRGFIWKNVMNAYGNFPFINKLFGLGEGTVRQALSYYSDEHWNMFDGSVVDNAHNIWIHMLVTMGIAGVMVLIFMVVTTAINVVKSFVEKSLHNADKENEDLLLEGYDDNLIAGIGIGAIVYAICGTGNLLEVITFPMFICMMAIMSTYNKNCGS